jgi:hypothetical protein
MSEKPDQRTIGLQFNVHVHLICHSLPVSKWKDDKPDIILTNVIEQKTSASCGIPKNCMEYEMAKGDYLQRERECLRD